VTHQVLGDTVGELALDILRSQFSDTVSVCLRATLNNPLKSAAFSHQSAVRFQRLLKSENSDRLAAF
jgi:hypothetical protein